MRYHTIMALASTTVLASAASAQITGFPINASLQSWQVNRWDPAPPSPINPPLSITLTTTTLGQSRSAFYRTTQDITRFQVGYTYQFTGTQQNIMGAAFVLQNRGVGTVARGRASGVSTNFGYTDAFGAFSGPSLAVSMQSQYLGAGSSSTGVYTGGSFGGGSTSTDPLNFFSGNPIDVAINYDGALLSMTAMDTVTGENFASSVVQIDIPALMGGSLAYVGFTGSTNSNSNTTQTFSNFQFVTIPPACYPDCDPSTGPGVLDIFDFLCFQDSFVSGEPYACDCDTSTGNGVCDIFDFLCFQNAFVAGCP